MIYRKLDDNGDYTIGLRSGNFLVDSPEAVGQAVTTRLRLIQGEWFLDTTTGTPYSSKILGTGKTDTYAQAIKQVILGTQGVKSLISFNGVIDHNTRTVLISATIDTIYGQTSITSNI